MPHKSEDMTQEEVNSESCLAQVALKLTICLQSPHESSVASMGGTSNWAGGFEPVGGFQVRLLFGKEAGQLNGHEWPF